jgi:hypothetical protein
LLKSKRIPINIGGKEIRKNVRTVLVVLNEIANAIPKSKKIIPPETGFFHVKINIIKIRIAGRSSIIIPIPSLSKENIPINKI